MVWGWGEEWVGTMWGRRVVVVVVVMAVAVAVMAVVGGRVG